MSSGQATQQTLFLVSKSNILQKKIFLDLSLTQTIPRLRYLQNHSSYVIPGAVPFLNCKTAPKPTGCVKRQSRGSYPVAVSERGIFLSIWAYQAYFSVLLLLFQGTIRHLRAEINWTGGRDESRGHIFSPNRSETQQTRDEKKKRLHSVSFVWAILHLKCRRAAGGQRHMSGSLTDSRKRMPPPNIFLTLPPACRPFFALRLLLLHLLPARLAPAVQLFTPVFRFWRFFRNSDAHAADRCLSDSSIYPRPPCELGDTS